MAPEAPADLGGRPGSRQYLSAIETGSLLPGASRGAVSGGAAVSRRRSPHPGAGDGGYRLGVHLAIRLSAALTVL